MGCRLCAVPWQLYNSRNLLLNTMNILISNDDGYQAPGIVALYEALKDLGHVEVVAPEQNNSAKSNALTLHSPLYVHQASNVHAVSGGAVDIAKTIARLMHI